jgi:hypothetical protein
LAPPQFTRARRNLTAQLERGMTAVSPITDIDFPTALAALKGEPQAKFAQASAEIDAGLRVEAKDVGVVGAWKDGAENTLVTNVTHADWDRLTASAAMKAHLSNQKAALVFLPGEGDSALYKMHVAATCPKASRRPQHPLPSISICADVNGASFGKSTSEAYLSSNACRNRRLRISPLDALHG